MYKIFVIIIIYGLNNAYVYIVIFVGGTYGSRIATRYCMTVSDVDGNFLQLGRNASEPEDARAVMLVDSIVFNIFFCILGHITPN